MSTASSLPSILIFLFAFLAIQPAEAQQSVYEVLDIIDLPPELNPELNTSCRLEFQEQWVLNVAKASISKEINAYGISCTDSTERLSLPEGAIRLKDISYEFSFLDLLDLLDQRARKLQEEVIALINIKNPIPEIYDPREQLLSVYFHEEWGIDADHQVFTKRVKGITPVIWQQRQTTSGEAIHDAETGYPVYYKLKLDRIDLRQP
jgi:hypothetical protein